MKKAAARLKHASFAGFVCFAMIFGIALLSPNTVKTAAGDGLRLCGQVIIPSLFPFFVLANLFVSLSYHRYIASALRPVMKPLFGLSGAAAGALALGTVGGYPIGAATIFQLYDRKELSSAQASRALAFCNNAGPGFILGMAGLSLLGSVRLGMLLWAVHLLSALLVGLLFRQTDHGILAVRPASADDGKPFTTAVVEAVADSVTAILRVCGFLVFFSVVLAFLQKTRFWELASAVPFGPALLDGTVELSSGIAHLMNSGCSTVDTMTCAAFLLGWGGLCVHFQVLSLKGRREIRMLPYWLGKLLQGLLSAALVRLIVAPSLTSTLTVLLLTVPGLLFRKVCTGKQALSGV